MATRATNATAKKRKQSEVDGSEKDYIINLGELEVESDGENSSGVDDGEMDAFPELDTSSSEDSSDSEQGDGTQETDESEDGSKTPPKPGDLVLSSITGRLKRVFPEIEPEYDSDSSTEDVCRFSSCAWHSVKHLENRLPIALATFPHIGMTTSRTSVTISTASECYGLQRATN